jgi:hypothetical protein
VIEIDWQMVGESIAQETMKWFGVFWDGIIWPIIDFVIFIELENPTGEVIIFVSLISIICGTIFGAIKLLPRAIEREMYDQR